MRGGPARPGSGSAFRRVAAARASHGHVKAVRRPAILYLLRRRQRRGRRPRALVVFSLPSGVGRHRRRGAAAGGGRFRKRDGVPMAVVAPTDDQHGHVAVRVGAARRLDAVKLAGGNLTCPVWGACWGDGGVAAVTLASALGHRPRRRLWTPPAVPVVPASPPSHFPAAFAPPPPLVPVFHGHVRRGAELTTPTTEGTSAASVRVRRAVGRCRWRPCQPTGNAKLEFRQISATYAVMAPFWLHWL